MGRNMPRTEPEVTIPFTCPYCGLHTDVDATFVGLLSLCVLGIVVWSVLQPALRSARDGARCAECKSKLCRIGQAVEDYHNKHNRYLSCSGLR